MFTLDGYPNIERTPYQSKSVGVAEFNKRLAYRLNLPNYLARRVYAGVYDVMYDALLHGEAVKFQEMLTITPTSYSTLYRNYEDLGWSRNPLLFDLRIATSTRLRKVHETYWDHSELYAKYPKYPTDEELTIALAGNKKVYRSDTSVRLYDKIFTGLERNPDWTFDDNI